ncbi:MAG TPA: S1 family peptidase [Xanthomonadaceae bacterium]|nr:S1 family peptidase [Xanthomonadaceae bacterium]
MRKFVSRGLLVLSPLTLAVAMAASAAPATPDRPGSPEALNPAVQSAMQRDLGLTGPEVAQYMQVERMATTVGKQLASAQGANYAGTWIERTPRGFELVVATTANQAKRQPKGTSVRLVDDSFAELNMAKAKLDGAASRRGAANGVYGWYVDVRNNSVTINVAPGARQAAIDFVARSNADIGTVRFETMASQPKPLATLMGGSEYLSNDGTNYYYCSVGFAVTSNGAQGFATAGHCGSAGDGAFVLVSRRTVSQIGAFAASSFPNGDKAWVQVANNHTLLPVVQGGKGNGDIPVHGSIEAPVGATVCRSGRTTGMHCGTIEAKNVTVQYPDTSVGGLTQVKVCAEGGDSGGSFITGAGQAQGVLSGGNYSCKGKQASLATSYFQPINPLLQSYNLTLKTQ